MAAQLRCRWIAFAIAGAAWAPLPALADCQSSDPCTIDLGKAVAHLGLGAASYFAEATQLQGSDSYFGAVPEFLSSLAITSNGNQVSMAFVPQVYSAVGGSGIDGYHEVVAFFEFYEVSFAAVSGYRIDSVEFWTSGSYGSVGDAFVGLGLPGSVSYAGENFSSSAMVDPAYAAVRAEFTTAAAYLQGDDGTAVYYGTAHASFSGAGYRINLSPVPEPAPYALLMVGLLAGAMRVRRSAGKPA